LAPVFWRGAVLCLLLPLFVFIYGATKGGAFMGIISLGVSVLFAILLASIGLVLAYFGYRLTTEGISKKTSLRKLRETRRALTQKEKEAIWL